MEKVRQEPVPLAGEWATASKTPQTGKTLRINPNNPQEAVWGWEEAAAWATDVPVEPGAAVAVEAVEGGIAELG